MTVPPPRYPDLYGAGGKPAQDERDRRDQAAHIHCTCLQPTRPNRCLACHELISDVSPRPFVRPVESG